MSCIAQGLVARAVGAAMARQKNSEAACAASPVDGALAEERTCIICVFRDLEGQRRADLAAFVSSVVASVYAQATHGLGQTNSRLHVLVNTQGQTEAVQGRGSANRVEQTALLVVITRCCCRWSRQPRNQRRPWKRSCPNRCRCRKRRPKPCRPWRSRDPSPKHRCL